MRKEFKKRENGEQSSMTAERIAALDNLGFEWVVSRCESQPSTRSTSSKHHQLKNNKHDPNKAPMCHDRSQEQQCRKQHQHGQKEMTPAFPFRASEEGGFAFLGVSEEISRNGHQHHVQKEVAPAVPRRDSEAGGVDNESYWV